MINMKKIKLFGCFIVLSAITISCTESGIDNDTSFLSTVASGNYNKIFDISADNSGIVKITPTGEGVVSYDINFGDRNSKTTILATQSALHSYPEGSYTVSITSKDLVGKETTTTYPLQVTYRAPENIVVNIGGDMALNATALYAKSFLVYYGDVANEVGTVMGVGESLPGHIYLTNGPNNLRVVALSGGLATSQSIIPLYGFPIDFENTTLDYPIGTYGGVSFSKVPNPSPTGLNTSATVAKYTKAIGAPNWGGTYSTLSVPANFALGRKVKVLVYNTDAANIGKNISLIFQDGIAISGAPGDVSASAPITTVNAWEELVFNFSQLAATARFNSFNFNYNNSASGAGEVVYLDNLRITN